MYKQPVESRFGRYYDDFTVGDVYRHWPGKTVTESDNHLFSLLTMNHHPVHIDTAYAEHAKHGRILVVGTYVLSVVVGMSVADVSGRAIANLEYSAVKHVGPVFVGDTLYAETTVTDLRCSNSSPQRGIVSVDTVGRNQHSEAVISFQRTVLVPCRNG